MLFFWMCLLVVVGVFYYLGLGLFGYCFACLSLCAGGCLLLLVMWVVCLSCLVEYCLFNCYFVMLFVLELLFYVFVFEV